MIENFIGKLTEFKRIARRADKTDQSFAAMIHLTAAAINSIPTDPGPAATPVRDVDDRDALRAQTPHEFEEARSIDAVERRGRLALPEKSW